MPKTVKQIKEELSQFSDDTVVLSGNRKGCGMDKLKVLVVL